MLLRKLSPGGVPSFMKALSRRYQSPSICKSRRRYGPLDCYGQVAGACSQFLQGTAQRFAARKIIAQSHNLTVVIELEEQTCKAL